MMSPRAWGWTGLCRGLRKVQCDVPTRVGVDRSKHSETGRTTRCPHARGGGPLVALGLQLLSEMSPRAWGWTDRDRRGVVRCVDVPTRVGVDRATRPPWRERTGCPHARGGGPKIQRHEARFVEMSPRAWGWTVDPAAHDCADVDVPTRVGVDRACSTNFQVCGRCRHARGGGRSGTGG